MFPLHLLISLKVLQKKKIVINFIGKKKKLLYSIFFYILTGFVNTYFLLMPYSGIVRMFILLYSAFVEIYC